VQRAPVHVEDVQQDPTLRDPDRGELSHLMRAKAASKQKVKKLQCS
jgi:hypothetical protein